MPHAILLFLRNLRRRPLVATISILTLGIGVGLTTSMAGVIQALMFQPAPFRAARELHRIESVAANGARSSLSVPEIEAVTAALGADVAAIPFRWVDAVIAAPDTPVESYVGVATTGTFFRDLGVPALLGRTYQPADVGTPDAPVVVLGHEFWRRRFGADPTIVGRTIRLNQRPVTVLGVMPPDFDYRRLWAFGDLWLPGTFMQDGRDNLEARQHPLMVRLPAGVRAEEVRARLAVVADRLAREHPVAEQRRHFVLMPLHASTVDPAFRRLAFLAAGVCALVLLIVCANLAGLQLSRALAQEHEFSVRAALGASRRRLVGDRLLESALLGVLGGGVGLLVALWCNSALQSAVTVGLAGRLNLQLNPAIFALACLLAVGAGLTAGAAPALLMARLDLNTVLRSGGRGSTGSHGRQALRHALIVLEIVLAVALVSTSVLLFRALQKFAGRPVGWEPAGVVFGTVSLPPQQYASSAQRQRFHDELERRLAAQPAVAAAALSSLPPVYSYWVTRSFRAEGAAAADAVHAFDVRVSPGYFSTLGLPLREGRAFARNNIADTDRAVVINEALARALWPGGSALGRRLLGADGAAPLEVIGVVPDVDFPANLEAPASPFQVYEPFARDPWSYITLAVRSRGSTADAAAAMRAALAQVDPSLPLSDVTDVPTEVAQRLANLRLALRSLAVFAAVGLVLALLGIYGTVAHHVAQRRRELGIRLALGATPQQVSREVLLQGGRVVALGLAGGVAAALVASRLLAVVLARASSPEPGALAGVCAAVAAAALLACWVPSRAAARVDPIETLRAE